MARRRKSGDAAIAGVLLIAAAVLAILFGLAIVAPIALFIWWLICEIGRAMLPHRRPGPEIDEQSQLDKLDTLLIEYKDSRATILRMGDDSGIPRRGDNLFDGRYSAARDINKQLDQVNTDIERFALEKSVIENRIQARIENWTKARARSLGARFAILSYIVLFAVIVESSPSWALAIGKLTDIFGLKLTDRVMISFGASVIASSIAGIALWLVDTVKAK